MLLGVYDVAGMQSGRRLTGGAESPTLPVQAVTNCPNLPLFLPQHLSTLAGQPLQTVVVYLCSCFSKFFQGGCLVFRALIPTVSPSMLDFAWLRCGDVA